MFRRAGPAGFGNIDDNAIGGTVFHLGVDMGRLSFAEAQRVVDVVADRCAGKG